MIIVDDVGSCDGNCADSDEGDVADAGDDDGLVGGVCSVVCVDTEVVNSIGSF